MKKPSDDEATRRDELRDEILGLGRRSGRKSYYPMLRSRLAELERFRVALDGSNDAILLVAATSGTIEDTNEAASRILGRPRPELIGGRIAEIIPPLAPLLERASELCSQRSTMQITLRGSSAGDVPVEVTSSFVRVGRELYLVAVARDVTERRRAQRAMRLVVDASTALSRSLDLATNLAGVADLVLPDLGDVLAVYRRTPDGVERLLLNGTTSVDAAMLSKLENRAPFGAELAVRRALQTANAEIVHEVPDTLLEASARDPEHLAELRALRLGSLLVAPFSAGTETFGALLFGVQRGGGRYDDLDLDVARQLAHRVAIELENARLYAEAQGAARRAEESLARLDTLLATAPVGIMFLDCELRYVRINAALAELHGVAPELTTGRRVDELLPDLATSILPILVEVLQTGKPRLNVEIAYRFPTDPSRTHWLASYYPVCTPSGALLGIGVVVVDITGRKLADAERERLLERERAARGEAERACRAKDEFVAAVSHELRTPLHAIQGWTELGCRAGATPDQMAKSLAVVHRSSRQLAQIVSDLLDVSRIASGKLHIEFAQVHLRGVVVAALEALHAVAAAKGVAIRDHVSIDGDFVQGDALRLQQVVSNLVENAIKFTPAGGRVDIELTRVADRAVLVVRDTGQGIEPEFLPYVFDRFRQADASMARRHGGLGLGLAITRSVIDLHSGAIWADSAGADKGACFTVTLPISSAGMDAGARSTGPEAPLAPLDGLRVLVVEDEPDARELVQRLLQDVGAEVVVVASAPAALAALEVWVPGVLVSDIGLPGMDGFELIRRIRAGNVSRAATIPAIALTAFARPDDHAQALREGFHVHLAKPVEPAALVAAIRRLARANDAQATDTPQ